MKDTLIDYIVLFFEFLFYIIDSIVPRFMDTIAFYELNEDGEYDYICLSDYANEDDEPDAVQGVKLFKWFGIVYIYRQTELVLCG